MSPDPTITELKAEWRRVLKGAVDPSVNDETNQRTCRSISRFLSSEVPSSRYVVVYDALPEELDLSGIVAEHGDPHTRFAVTRTPEEGLALTLHPFGGPVERHRYGYLQPSAGAPTIDDGDVGAVLVPALGFDRQGNRMGRGKGYYDRLLARLLEARSDSLDRLVIVGVAGGHIAAELPIDDYDVPMTHLALTTGVWPVPLPDSALDDIVGVERSGSA